MNRLLLPLILSLTAVACSAESPATGQSNAQNPNTQNLKIQEQTMSQHTVSVSINNQVFEVQLENNPTAQAFAELLPLDLTMEDHLNNEKFATLPKSLPTNDKTAGQIHAGDVMLWQGNTVVIFYESFHSNYRYTKIGRISNADTLKHTLGRGDVVVKWNAK